nr:MFS transporter [Hoeflea prorocentri]
MSVPIACLQCFCAGSLYAWSAMITALRESFGVSVEHAGFVFSIAIISFTLALLLSARLPIDLSGPRARSVFCLVGAVALLASSMAGSFPLFAICFGVGFGAASGAIYLACLDVAARSDARRADMNTALVVAAFGLGGAVFGPALRLLVAQGWGLQALLLPALCLVFAACFAVLGKSDNRRITREKIDAEKASHHNDLNVGLWLPLLWFGFAFASAAGLMTLGLAGAIIEEGGGSVWLSGAGIAAIAIANTTGRLCSGLFTRIVRLDRLIVLPPLLSSFGLFVCIWVAEPAAIVVGLVVVALAYGLVASLYPIVTRQLLGSDGFARYFSIIFTAWGLAGLASPWLAGAVLARSGDFRAALGVGVAAAVVSMALSIATAVFLRRAVVRGVR